mgnify:FL=1
MSVPCESYADMVGVGDVRFQLIAMNLPGLTRLHLCSNLTNLVYNNLSDIAAQSICQLQRLTELFIGADNPT